MERGGEADGLKVIEEVKGMPSMKDMYGTGYDPRVYALVAFPARYALEMHHWAEAASLTPVPEARAGDASITYWARAIGAARSGNVAQARTDISQIDALHKTRLDQKKKMFADAVDQGRKEAAALLGDPAAKDGHASA